MVGKPGRLALSIKMAVLGRITAYRQQKGAVLYDRKANALLARVGGLRIAADSFPLYGLREDQFLEMLSDFEAGIDVEHIFAVVQRF